MREGTLEGTFVFAYGSNMDSSRLQGWAPSAEAVGTTRHIATEERCDVHLKPTHVYLAHVVRGAREHGLPLEVIAELEATPTQD